MEGLAHCSRCSAHCCRPSNLQAKQRSCPQVRRVRSATSLGFDLSRPCMRTCQHLSTTVRCSFLWLCIGFKPVPATSKSEIDAALHKLAANKQKWIAQPCSRRAALLRACIQQALKVVLCSAVFVGTCPFDSNSFKI